MLVSAGWCALALGVVMSGPAASVSRRQPLPSLLAGAMRALNRVTSFVPPPPSDKDGVKEKIVVVQVHPNGKDPSFTLALGQAVRDSLKDAGAWAFVEIMNEISPVPSRLPSTHGVKDFQHNFLDCYD